MPNMDSGGGLTCSETSGVEERHRDEEERHKEGDAEDQGVETHPRRPLSVFGFLCRVRPELVPRYEPGANHHSPHQNRIYDLQTLIAEQPHQEVVTQKSHK